MAIGQGTFERTFPPVPDLPYCGISTETTTPLSDENAPVPTQTRRTNKEAPTPEAEGAGGVEVVRRSSEESETGSEKNAPPNAKVDAVAHLAPGTESDPAAASAPRPGSAAKSPPAPVWAPEPERERPPPIPSWDRTSESMSWPDARWEHSSQTTLPRAPLHPAFRSRGRPRRPSRAFVTTVALASLCVVFVAVAVVVMSSLHQSTPATAGPRVASASAVSSSSASRLQAATDTTVAATTTTRSRLEAISGIPTPAKVAAVINPYVSSLQRYETTLTGTTVPTPARSAAASARTLVSLDVQYLMTIEGLAPLRLGSYLEQFGKNATQLQADLSRLEGELRTATS
jgi:hypothetical protein